MFSKFKKKKDKVWSSMFRKRNKKQDKLWTAHETLRKEYSRNADATTNVQQRQHHHQHLHHLQMQQTFMTPNVCDSRCYAECFCNQLQSQQLNTIPYACLNSNRCFAGVVDNGIASMEMEFGSEEMSLEQDFEIMTDGSYCESCGDNSNDCNEGEDYDRQYAHCLSRQTSYHQQIPILPKTTCNYNNNYTNNNNSSSKNNNNTTSKNNSSSSNNTNNNSTTKINCNGRSNATMAADVLRKCCCTGGGTISTESSIGNPNLKNTTTTNNNNNSSSTALVTTEQPTTSTSAITAITTNAFRHCLSTESSVGSQICCHNKGNYTLNNNNIHINPFREMFENLMKKLNDTQRGALCQVVGCYSKAESFSNSDNNNSNNWSTDCILVAHEGNVDVPPNVIACQLWLWPDLQDFTELKRTPACQSAKDEVYVCCNLRHWNRILTPGFAPPPYREPEMNRLKPEDRAPSENLEDGGVSTVSGSTTGLRVLIPESFTTNGEDSSSLTWCEVFYWQFRDRVGKKYVATNSTVNIYSKGSGGMCLNELYLESRTNNNSKGSGGMGFNELGRETRTPTQENVQKTRESIGLGITLSQEDDGIWLYNRSTAPVFVLSPTLTEDWSNVCKVPPGYCLIAFDKNRAATQKPWAPHQQTGPIDPYSMFISFAKGWGSTYTRTSIFACPCWVEVKFLRR